MRLNIVMSAFAYSLLAALVWGISPMFEKYAVGRADPLVGLVLRGAGVAVGSAVVYFALPQSTAWKTLTPGVVLCFAGAGVLASIIGQIFAYNALQRADVSQVTPIMGSWPLITVLLGMLLFREPVTARKIFGAASIVLGVWLLR